MNKEENDILVELLTLQKEIQKVDRHIYNNYKKKIYKLKNRINKAIEYIERNCLEFNVKYACQGLNNDKVDVLLDILRGEDNE